MMGGSEEVGGQRLDGERRGHGKEQQSVGSPTPVGGRATRSSVRGRGLAGAQRRLLRKTLFSSAPQAIFFLGRRLETPFPLILGV